MARATDDGDGRRQAVIGAGPSPLAEALRAHVRAQGPISVAQFMSACLTDPTHGYYHRPHVIGARGDFVTAPEISQVFGELVGLWCAVVWQQMGSPAEVAVIELGPGRGTLMADAVRAARVLPAFRDALRIGFVEVSATLHGAQADRMARAGLTARWSDHLAAALAERPDLPAIVIGNEFVDALPVHQAVVVDGVWRERVVDVVDGDLAFAAGAPVPPPAAVAGLVCADGTIFETRPAVRTLMDDLARHRAPVAGLLIDYGHERSTAGDTLQAVAGHARADILSSAGVADITALVDFAALARDAAGAGLAVDGPVSQTRFLGALGAAERASRLMAARPDRAAEIETGVARLMAAPGMGSRFKVIGVRTPSLAPLPGLA